MPAWIWLLILIGTIYLVAVGFPAWAALLGSCAVVTIFIILYRAAHSPSFTGARPVQSWARPHGASDIAEADRRRVEARIICLLIEFPAMSDAQIGILLHDELINQRVDSRHAWEWATEESVARIRRTLMIEAIRAKRLG